MQRRGAGPGPSAAAAAAVSPPPVPPPTRQAWRKVLWAQQEGYDDAHTGESFLEDLVVNATVPHRDYSTVVWSSLVVDQQLSTVAAVGSASYHLHQGTITTRQLLLVDVLLMLLGALLYLGSAAWVAAKGAAAAALGDPAAGGCHSLSASPHKSMFRNQAHWPGDVGMAAPSPSKHPHCQQQKQQQHFPIAASPHQQQQPQQQQPQQLQLSFTASQQQQLPGAPSQPQEELGAAIWRPDIADGLSSLAALAVATALLSPLLGTLTETVSSDSIIACACLLLLAHLYLHDYHFTANLTAQLSGSLALGCAVCGSVLIASRLGSPEAVYAQLLLSLELYILAPYCRRQLAAASPAAHLALTLAMVAAATWLLSRQAPLLTSSFLCSVLFVTFLCPMWLVRIHKFKAAINGPWDEAVPRLSAAVTRHLSRH